MQISERNICLKNDLTYISETKRAEATPNSIGKYGEACAKYNTDAVVRYERAIFTATTWESMKAYYEDIFKMCAEHDFSWFSNDWWVMTNDMSSEVLNWPKQKYEGYENFNLELLQLIQKYQSKER